MLEKVSSKEAKVAILADGCNQFRLKLLTLGEFTDALTRYRLNDQAVFAVNDDASGISFEVDEYVDRLNNAHRHVKGAVRDCREMSIEVIFLFCNHNVVVKNKGLMALQDEPILVLDIKEVA